MKHETTLCKFKMKMLTDVRRLQTEFNTKTLEGLQTNQFSYQFENNVLFHLQAPPANKRALPLDST